MTGADEAYDRLHGLDGQTQEPPPIELTPAERADLTYAYYQINNAESVLEAATKVKSDAAYAALGILTQAWASPPAGYADRVVRLLRWVDELMTRVNEQSAAVIRVDQTLEAWTAETVANAGQDRLRISPYVAGYLDASHRALEIVQQAREVPA